MAHKFSRGGMGGKGRIMVIPAILSKDKADFQQKLSFVSPYVSRIQIDIMDGKFVPNLTLQPEDFPEIPRSLEVEYHLMVENPLEYVERIGKRDAIYEIHVESLKDKTIEGAISEIKKMGGRVALAISPDTPTFVVEPHIQKIEHVLVMTVYPGFSGQSYIPAMEDKIARLRSLGAVVEVDGGIDLGTAKRACAAGATLLSAASAIFSNKDAKKAIEALERACLISQSKWDF